MVRVRCLLPAREDFEPCRPVLRKAFAGVPAPTPTSGQHAWRVSQRSGLSGAAIGSGRAPGRPCLVGSVKSNTGHPEAAGGLAGLIKAALVVRHRRVPAALRCPNPASAVDWAGSGIALASAPVDWPDPGRALAGVSTYGLSGTFVHLVVGEF